MNAERLSSSAFTQPEYITFETSLLESFNQDEPDVKKRSICRYLSYNFPKVLSLVDQQGRTALHYAAVTEESGHYYKLLVNAGADPSAKDKVCRTKLKGLISYESARRPFKYIF